MIAGIERPSIAEAIGGLYAEAGVAQATADRPIVALHQLVGGFNLNCSELAGLTSHAAIRALLKRGGIAEPPERLSDDPLAGFIVPTR